MIGVSLIFNKESYPQIDGYYERYAYYDDDGIIPLGSYINGNTLDTDPDWTQCYINDKTRWSDISEEYLSGHDEICFVVPLYGNGGNRVGIAYSEQHKQARTADLLSSHTPSRESILTVSLTPKASVTITPKSFPSLAA